MKPTDRPQLSHDDCLKVIRSKGGVEQFPILLGVRGYFRDSMGVAGQNDRGIYDDAIFIVGASRRFAYNANTDPSVARKGVAVLDPGTWSYESGFHGISGDHPYPALRQRGPVRVHRDGIGRDFGQFAINIHRGSQHSTSSLGCQTIHPDQWREFIDNVYDAMTIPRDTGGARARKPITYVLVTRADLEDVLGRSL